MEIQVLFCKKSHIHIHVNFIVPNMEPQKKQPEMIPNGTTFLLINQAPVEQPPSGPKKIPEERQELAWNLLENGPQKNQLYIIYSGRFFSIVGGWNKSSYPLIMTIIGIMILFLTSSGPRCMELGVFLLGCETAIFSSKRWGLSSW